LEQRPSFQQTQPYPQTISDKVVWNHNCCQSTFCCAASRMRKLFAIKVYAKFFNVNMAALLVAAMVPSLITSAFGTE
jgi:hypothetical protein